MKNTKKFNSWIDIFIAEKGINIDQNLSIEGENGLNIMPVGAVIEAMKATSREEQEQIKKTFIQIDFKNGDPLHFIKHLAQAIAQ